MCSSLGYGVGISLLSNIQDSSPIIEILSRMTNYGNWG